MQRRQFIRNSMLTVGASAIFSPSCLMSKVGEMPFSFQELNFKSVSEFWFLMLSYYQKNLSSSKTWFTDPGPQRNWGGKIDPEGPLRMMFGFGGWFSKPGRPAIVNYKGTDINIQELFLSAVTKGTDPTVKDCWDMDNRSAWIYPVDSPNLGWAIWLSKNRFKDDLSENDRENIDKWLNRVDNKKRLNNWALFDVMRHTSLKAMGMHYDPKLIEERLAFTDTLYRKDGWYSDQHLEEVYDDYNNWVFHSHLMYIMIMEGGENDPRFAVWRERLHVFLKKQIYLYGKDGSHPQYGRSQLYKFARLVSLILGYRLGISPIPVGQLRRLIRLHFSYYLNNGAVDPKTGKVDQKLAASASYAVREYYSSPGSVYWCTMALGALFLLDENDPLFNTAEMPLPIEEASYDVSVELPVWLIHGEKETGHTILYRTGPHKRTKTCLTDDSDLHYASKYRRFAYHSHLGYTIGRSCDNMAYLRVGEDTERYLPLHLKSDIQLVDGTPVLRGVSKYETGSDTVLLSTILIVMGEAHLRFHAVQSNVEGKNMFLDEGGYALGRTENDSTEVTESERTASVKNSNGMSLISVITGYDKLLAAPFGYSGKESIHSGNVYNALPFATSNQPLQNNSVFGLFVKGSANAFSENLSEKIKIQKLESSEIAIDLGDGKIIEMKFLQKS